MRSCGYFEQTYFKNEKGIPLSRHYLDLSSLLLMTSVGNVICKENNSLLRSPELMEYDP